ncbi:MAG TPA: hypothetical protein VF039_00455 [Longimicrobiales bacterium]
MTRRRALPLLLLALLPAFAGAHGARPLPFYYDVYTFRGANGTTDVVAAFSVPAGRLESERVSRRTRYRFDVSLILTDPARDTVIRTDDSVYVEVRRPLDGDHLLFTQIEVAAPPVPMEQRVIMSDATTPGIGQLYTDDIRIPSYAGDSLMLSDIALGQPEQPGGWQRGAVAVALLPTERFPGNEFDVFYEVYNLPPGSDYRTEIAVERIDARGNPLENTRAAVRFRGDATTRGGVMAELRRLHTSLARGKHRITVTVTDVASGASATRSRLFTVRDDARATMVPALPR